MDDRAVSLRLRLLAALVLPAWLFAACASQQGPTVTPASSDTSVPAASAQTAMPESDEESETRRRARIRLELGASYYQQGNYQVALQELRQALTIDPNYAAAYGVLGLVYMDLGDRARAEESFQRGLRLSPTDSDVANNYGWFLCQGGRYKESLEMFARALRNPLYTTPARPLHNAGICARRMGDDKAAEDYFQRSFQVDPGNPVAMYNLGELYLKRGELDRAKFYSSRLLSNFDPTAEILWLALRVERRLGNREAEASLGAQLRRRFPTSPEVSRLAAGKYED
jgi:type IV pilus assembly protein PilF